MNLINKPLNLYFCTALLCHAVLFSSLYHWSSHAVAGIEPARSVTTYFSPMVVMASVGSQIQHTKSSAQPTNQIPTLTGTTSTAIRQHYSNSTSQTTFVRERQNESYDRSHIDAITPREKPTTLQTHDQGNVKLLAVLHNAIEQHQNYPLNAVMAQQSGTAIIDFTLLPNGNVIHSTLKQSSGYTDLDQAALEAVRAISPFKALATHAQQTFNVAVSFILR